MICRGRTIKIEHIVRKTGHWGKKNMCSISQEAKQLHSNVFSFLLFPISNSYTFIKTKQLLRQLITIFTNLKINPPEREIYLIKIRPCHYVKCILQRKLLISFKIRDLFYTDLLASGFSIWFLLFSVHWNILPCNKMLILQTVGNVACINTCNCF